MMRENRITFQLMICLAVGLLVTACGSGLEDGGSESVEPGARTLGADPAPTGELADPMPDDNLELGDPSTDPALIGVTLSQTINLDAAVYEHPALLLQQSDVAGAGTVVAAFEGRRAGSFHNTTLAVRVDEWVRGDTTESSEDGVVYIEVTHSPLVTAAEVALGIPRDARVVFIANDFSEWDAHDPVENPRAGRPPGADVPLFSVHPQGLWFVDGGQLVNFREPKAPLPDAWSPGASEASAEAFLLAALKVSPEDVVVPVEAEVCADFSELDVDSIIGIGDELRDEIRRVISADSCITTAEYSAFLAEHPELLDAQLTTPEHSHGDGSDHDHSHSHEEGE